MRKLLTIFLILFSVASQSQNILFYAGFENPNPFTNFQYGNEFCCSYSVIRSTDQHRAGVSSVKFDLFRTDPIVSSSIRAEIEPLNVDAPTESDRWYGLSYFLVNYATDEGAESLIQWHDVDGTCPPLSLQIQGGRMRIQQCIDNNNTPNDIGPVASGVWIDIIIHVKWTTSNNGVIEVWRNGVQVVNKRNVRTNSTGGNYLKLGINKWSWFPGTINSNQTERTFYVDEFRIGNENSGFDAVNPDQSFALPVMWGRFYYDDYLRKLYWSTYTESNVSYFFIDKSYDGGKTWNRVAVINPLTGGNSTSQLFYNYRL